eukprot:6778100-Alexandrium_andersonii.AAC.1
MAPRRPPPPWIGGGAASPPRKADHYPSAAAPPRAPQAAPAHCAPVARLPVQTVRAAPRGPVAPRAAGGRSEPTPPVRAGRLGTPVGTATHHCRWGLGRRSCAGRPHLRGGAT